MSAPDAALFVGDASKAQLESGVATKLVAAHGVINVLPVGTAEANGMMRRALAMQAVLRSLLTSRRARCSCAATAAAIRV